MEDFSYFYLYKSQDNLQEGLDFRSQTHNK